MSELTLQIDQQAVSVKPGDTILTGAQKLGINIPTLCHLNSLKPFTSCMICVVEDTASGRLLPACSTPAQAGMVLITESEKIRIHRKTALELLLSEHVGDCEGPCRRICPAGMDIPVMMRHIEHDRWDKAMAVIMEHIPLPGILGRICPAPCEKGCRRGQVDEALAICLLKMRVADWDLEQPRPFEAEMAPATGKKAAVVGSGPAGLTAAYYLMRQGHAVTLFEKAPELGGGLRTDVPQVRLPQAVLTAEISRITAMGCSIKTGATLDSAAWQKDFDGAVLAMGPVTEADWPELEHSPHGLAVDSETLVTSMAGVYAAGATIRPAKLAVKSVGQGRQAAWHLHQHLTGQGFGPHPWKLNSKAGKLTETEIENYKALNACAPVKAQEPLSKDTAIAEACRCLHCECAKPESCSLRHLAEIYEARTQAYPGHERAAIQRQTAHADLVYEAGKCIRCGICIRLTEKEGEALGLTFIGRGFDVQVGVPLNRSMEAALTKTARAVVEACPTGALAFKNAKE